MIQHFDLMAIDTGFGLGLSFWGIDYVWVSLWIGQGFGIGIMFGLSVQAKVLTSEQLLLDHSLDGRID